MGVKWTTKTNKLPSLYNTVKAIGDRGVKVGALQGEHAWLAGVLEHGAHIKAGKVKYLTVPVCSEAAGKRAREIPDLFVYKSPKGNLMLARNEGGSLKFYYWLTPSINIPPRPFISAGHDENSARIIAQTERALGQVLAGKMSIDDMLDLYGQQMATAIKTYARDLRSPPNSPITIENKGSDNPLVGKTSALIEGITWKRE